MSTPYDLADPSGLPHPPTAGALGHGGPPPRRRADRPTAPARRLSPRVLLIDRCARCARCRCRWSACCRGRLLARSFLCRLRRGPTVIYTAVWWATFTYQVTEDRLLRRSLTGRSIRTIPRPHPRRRHQHPAAAPPPGLAVLRIDTGASGGGAEGELNALTAADPNGSGRADPARGRGTAAGQAAGAEPSAAPHRPPAAAAPEELAAAPRQPPAPPERTLARVPRAWLAYGPLSGPTCSPCSPRRCARRGAPGRGGLGISARTARSVGGGCWRTRTCWRCGRRVVLAMPVAGGLTYAVLH